MAKTKKKLPPMMPPFGEKADRSKGKMKPKSGKKKGAAKGMKPPKGMNPSAVPPMLGF